MTKNEKKRREPRLLEFIAATCSDQNGLMENMKHKSQKSHHFVLARDIFPTTEFLPRIL